ncbi:MAG: pilus assembly protein PilP [Deltaproteobacteria bacterium]|nr:pilus assembly protein PilP [Deltaproteobacteria bacterium]MCB9478762.1 pilus assembly protein PilP [Deltaproteobacteria bacterium]MCB9488278.1 pilus assembly protein PilP [Deltaproteobacteria bacterium]
MHCRFAKASTMAVALVLTFALILSACGGGSAPEPEPAPAAPAAPAAEEAKPEAVATPAPTPEKEKTEAEMAQEKMEKKFEKPAEADLAALQEAEKEETGKPVYSYDPINKVDPFSQSNIGSGDDDFGPDDGTVLTQYEIKYFRLVGVVFDEASPRAIFEDPRGRAYVVSVGTPIGRNLGVIEQILPEAVVVSEQRFVPGGLNELETVQVVIKLHPERESEG